MKKLIFILTLSLSTFSLKGQYSSSHVDLVINGELSDKYQEKFQTNFKDIPELLNKYKIPISLAPIRFLVDVERNYIYIIPISFDGSTVYNQHQRSWNRDDGISVWLFDQLFSVLTEFKLEVATENLSRDKRIMAIKNAILLEGEDETRVMFTASNSTNYQGFVTSDFSSYAYYYKGEEFYTIKANYKALEDYSFFLVGEREELNGKKTGAYYFMNFFGK